MTNPFVYDKPARASDLINRVDELAALRATAQSGQNVVLSSPRRYGKTTLLKRLVEDLRGQTPCVFVDLSGVITLDDFLSRIEEDFAPLRTWPQRGWDQIRKIGLKFTASAAGAAGVGVDASIDPRVAKEIRRVLRYPEGRFKRSGVRSLVILDEFQDLVQLEGPIDGLIRSVIQHHADAATYIFAGSHAGILEAIFSKQERPLYGQAKPFRLGPLDPEDLGAFIDARFADTGRSSRDAIGALLEVGRGHPQRTILLAHHLWEGTPPRSAATTEGCTRALEEADKELAIGFRLEWDRLNQTERETISAIAAGSPTAEFVVERLRGEGLVIEDTTPPLLVDPLFARWLGSSTTVARRSEPREVELVLNLLARDVSTWPADVDTRDQNSLVSRAAVARNLNARAQDADLPREEAELLERTIRSIIADVSEALDVPIPDARTKVTDALDPQVS